MLHGVRNKWDYYCLCAVNVFQYTKKNQTTVAGKQEIIATPTTATKPTVAPTNTPTPTVIKQPTTPQVLLSPHKTSCKIIDKINNLVAEKYLI
jgi:hypothetical protein